MCCFSPVAAPVGFFRRLFARSGRVHVVDTKIFARMLDSSTQALVYAMELGAAGEPSPDRGATGSGRIIDWGFAVFRLKPGKKAHIHPMACRFRTRDASRLFFPTVHVHDGQVHASARFDHSLYDQGERSERDERSVLMAPQDAHAIVARGEPVFRRTLRGELPNRDTWIALSASTPNTPASTRAA
jgi:hypothetical protein